MLFLFYFLLSSRVLFIDLLTFDENTYSDIIKDIKEKIHKYTVSGFFFDAVDCRVFKQHKIKLINQTEYMNIYLRSYNFRVLVILT